MFNMATVHQVAALILWAQMTASVYAEGCRSPNVHPGVAYDLLEVEEVTIAYFYCQNPDLNPEPEQWICNSGSWDHDDVVCKGKECPDPPALENGYYDDRTINRSQKGKAMYFCDPGYKMQGRSYLICRREKTGEFIWKPNPHKMTCVIDNDGGENGCNVPPNVEKARHDGERGREWFPEGYELRYTCGSGFIQSGPGQSKCGANNQWTTPEITCTVRNCGDPGRPDNGRRIGTVHTFGEQVTFECDPGFELSGHRITFCQSNAEWSYPRPTCNPVKCPVVHTPDHGSTFGSSREYGAEMKVSCQNGYMIQGESVPRGSSQFVITCQATGEWDVWPVQCMEVDCGHITEYFPHGTMIEQGTKWQDIVTFRCNADATMSGPDISECQENAHWSTPPPICWGKCRKPDVPNGRVSHYKLKNQHYFQWRDMPNEMENGTLIRITCYWGHDLYGSNEVVCQNKTWEHFPTCVPRPCNILKTKTGMDVSHHGANLQEGTGKVPHQTTATLTCSVGYTGTKGINKLESRCNLGTWTKQASTFTCNPNPCPKLTESGDGMIIRPIISSWHHTVSHGSESTLSCKSGYTGSGGLKSMTTICQLGTWSGNPDRFKCTPNPCQKLSPSSNINIYYHSQDVGEMIESGTLATIYCQKGLSGPRGEKQMTTKCNLGTWTNKPADFECHPDPCNEVSGPGLKVTYWNPQNWQTAAGKVKHNTEVTVTCDVGYISQYKFPRITTKCERGQWREDLQDFRCKEKPCKPVTPRNNTYIAYKDEDGKSVHVLHTEMDLLPSYSLTLTCNEGYSLADVNTSAVCKLGEWTPTVSKNPCILTSCQAIPQDDNTELWYNNADGRQTDNGLIKEGTIVQAQCLHGYDQQFNQSVCEAGNWKPHSALILCRPRGCEAIEHANLTHLSGPVIEGQYPHDSRFRIACKKGYHLDRPEVSDIVCQSGNWNENVTCNPDACMLDVNSTIFTVEKNGIFLQSGDQIPHNESAFITCLETSHTYSATCSAGQWIPKIPSCSAEKCTIPTISKGFWIYTGSQGEIMGSSVFPHTQIQFRCTEGHKLLGETISLYCQENGTWSQPLPSVVCEPATCKLPELISNGKYISHQVPQIMTVRDSAIWYQCDVGFSPVSGENTPRAAKISCDNGHIKPAVPACLKTCSLPDINGQYEGDVSSLKHGTNTTYKCSTSASSDDRILVQCNNGTLYPEQPACKQPATCKLPASISNGKYVDQNIQLIMTSRDPSILYKCDMGFTPVSGEKSPQAARVYCDDGQLNPAEPACLRDCPLPAIHGHYEGDISSLKHGTNTKYKCTTSVIPDDWTSVQCYDGRLIPEQPTCESPESSACNLPNLENGFFPNGYPGMVLQQGKFLSYSCNGGFTPLHSSATVTCHQDGILPQPGCIKTDCYADGSCIKVYEHCHYEDITINGRRASVESTNLHDCKEACRSLSTFICKTAEFDTDINVCIFSDSWARPARVTCIGNNTHHNTYKKTLLERSWSQGCQGPRSFQNGYWYIQNRPGEAVDLIFFCCKAGYILRGSPALECQGPWMNETVLPECEPENHFNYFGIYWGREIYTGQTFVNEHHVVIDCKRYLRSNADWMFVKGDLSPGTHESTGNQIQFNATSPMQGEVTYMCIYWSSKISKCVTMAFTND